MVYPNKENFSNSFGTLINLVLSICACVAAVIPMAIDFRVVDMDGITNRTDCYSESSIHDKDFQVTFWATVITVDLAISITIWAVLKLLMAFKVNICGRRSRVNIAAWIISNAVFTGLMVLTKMTHIVSVTRFVLTVLYRAIFVHICLTLFGKLEKLFCSW